MPGRGCHIGLRAAKEFDRVTLCTEDILSVQIGTGEGVKRWIYHRGCADVTSVFNGRQFNLKVRLCKTVMSIFDEDPFSI